MPPLKRLSLALLLGASFLPAGVQASVRETWRETAASAAPEPGAVLLAQDEESGEEPAAEEPAYEEPAAEEPAYEEPAAEEPAYEEPAAEEPAYEEPAAEEPAPEEPAAAEPAYEEPAAEEPAYQEPAAEEPAVEEPAAEEPVAEEPAAEEPAAEEPAAEAEQPAAEEPAAEDEQPAAEEAPAAEDEQPADAAEEPATEDEQPAAQDDQPAAEDESPAADDQQPAAEDDSPAAEDQQPAAEDESPAADDQQPAVADEPAADDEQPAAADEQPADDQDEAVADPAADAAVEAAVEQEADEPLVEDAPAEAEDPETLIAGEGIADDADTPEDVAAEVEQAATEAPDADGAFAESIEENGEPVEAQAVAPLFDSAKRDEADAVEPDEASAAAPPVSDAETQAFEAPAAFGRERFTGGEEVSEAPRFEAPSGGGTTVIVNQNTTIYESNQTLIINDRSSYEQRMSSYGYSDFGYRRFNNGYYAETARSRDGSYVVTTYDAYGNVLERTYNDPRGRAYVLAWYDVSLGPIRYEDVGRRLPPLRPRFPARYYVLSYAGAKADDVYRFLRKPPVERARRLYSIDEVKRSSRLRDTLPRVEVGNLSFATGSAKISRKDAALLKPLAAAMLKQIRANPAETFLIEGHTDAVGSNRSNLVLSDRRARAVAETLSRYYQVPPQNLSNQGYGEEFLKVRTNGPSAANRRVTIRRTTPLVTPVAKR